MRVSVQERQKRAGGSRGDWWVPPKPPQRNNEEQWLLVKMPIENIFFLKKIMLSPVTLIRFDGLKIGPSRLKIFPRGLQNAGQRCRFFCTCTLTSAHCITYIHMYTVHRIAKFLSRQIRWTCLDLIYFLIFIKSSTRCVFTMYLDENKELFKTICQNVCKIKISIFAL